MTAQWDAIIIGGGLAGSSAAIQLAEAGKRVLLLEKETKAHHKVCGEFLSYETQYYLTKLGIDLKALGAVAINHVQLIYGKRQLETQLPFQAMSLSRFILDEALLERAVDLGVDVRRGIKVNSTRNAGDLWSIIAENESFQSRSVFLATGKRDLKDMPRGDGTQNDYIGFKMHWRLSAEQTAMLENQVRIILFTGGYAGLEMVENGIANLCLVVTKERFKKIDKQWDLLLEAIQKEIPLIKTYFKDAVPCWSQPLAVYGIPYGFVYNNDKANEGLYRLGDQMGVIPSFSGDGMAIALHTAACAVTAILNSSTTYHSEMRKQLLPQIRRASRLSLLTSRPIGQSIAFTICRLPKVLFYIVKGTRLRAFN